MDIIKKIKRDIEADFNATIKSYVGPSRKKQHRFEAKRMLLRMILSDNIDPIDEKNKLALLRFELGKIRAAEIINHKAYVKISKMIDNGMESIAATLINMYRDQRKRKRND